MKIGVDCDGILYDFVASLQHFLTKYRGWSRFDLPDALSWNFWDDQWSMTLEEFLDYCADGVDSGVVFKWGDPEVHSVEVLEALREDGHTLHVVTNRSFGSRSVENTESWLVEHGVPFDTLTFSKDKTVVPVDIFIEDNVDNYNALVDAGVCAVMFDRPWNQDKEDAHRVYDWWEFYDFVQDIHEGTEFIDNTLAKPEYETGLQEAQRLVYGERQASYSHPKDDYDRTTSIWNTILKSKLRDGEGITPQDAVLMMIGVKMSRLVHNNTHRDSAVDVAGYAECLLRINRREKGLE